MGAHRFVNKTKQSNRIEHVWSECPLVLLTVCLSFPSPGWRQTLWKYILLSGASRHLLRFPSHPPGRFIKKCYPIDPKPRMLHLYEHCREEWCVRFYIPDGRDCLRTRVMHPHQARGISQRLKAAWLPSNGNCAVRGVVKPNASRLKAVM